MRTTRSSSSVVLLVAIALAALALSGCPTPEGGTSASGGAKGEIEIAYVEWADAVAASNVIAAVLEDEGWQVELTPVSAAVMWQAVATGDADVMVSAWLPTTHADYYAEVKEKVESLGPNLEGTRIGLVAPDYVEVTSIGQLAEHAEKLDGRIIGIDAGAGLMKSTETLIEAYGLGEKLELIEGSDATMTAALKSAIAEKRWIVVTGWTPHWKFARWKLHYLDDPKNVYGEGGHIDTIARKGLAEEKPGAHAILDAFSWTTEDVAQVMAWTEEGAEPPDAARRWVTENADRVAAWTAAGASGD